MAIDTNIVVIAGRLGQDSKLLYTQSGQPILRFSIANSQDYKKNDQWVDQTYWFDVVCFGKYAENLSKNISKGTKVFVEGRLEMRRFKDKSEQMRTVYEVNASKITVASDQTQRKVDDQDRIDDKRESFIANTMTEEDIPF